MKRIQITILFLSITFSFSTLQAQQGKTQLGLHYSVGLPMGSFKDNLSESSFRGFQAEVLYGITDRLSIGLGTGYQDFYQKNPRQLYKLTDGSDISAVLTHSIQTIPLLAQAKYQFVPGAAVQPYVALGVGGNLVSFNELLGQFGGMDTKFRFAASREAGVYIPFRKMGESGVVLGASYHIMPFNQSSFSNLNFLGLHAGVRLPLRK